MSRKRLSIIGRQLYAILPQLYRARDNTVRSDGAVETPGDLALYLDAFGQLLDRVRNTLDQRLADSFPDRPADGSASCQDWLLPYFAGLLDVRLVSPDAETRRAEIMNAVAWRQRKGTPACVERIAETIGGIEVEVQEGWKRVAVTPRIGAPLLPATALGESGDCPGAPPSIAAAHPGLPAATVDFRRASRAVQAEPGNPAAHTTRFGSGTVTWRQAEPHGVPCFPDSFQDVSRRSVEVTGRAGRDARYHPGKVLLYTPPPAGFFPDTRIQLPWRWIRAAIPEHDAVAYVVRYPDNGRWGVERVLEPEEGARDFRSHVEVRRQDGTLFLRNLDPGQAVEVAGAMVLKGAGSFQIQDLVLRNRLEVEAPGRLMLRGVAAPQVWVKTEDIAEPVLDAVSCLFGKLRVPTGLARLEYCTVLGPTIAEGLQASDCIFAGRVSKDVTGPLEPPDPRCVRFSRSPWAPAGGCARSNTRDQPLFLGTSYGEPGCGTLARACPESVTAGAEDGGEMGAYHPRRYVLCRSAVLQKLSGYLPVGVDAQLIDDATLEHIPPRLTQTNKSDEGEES